MIARKEWGNGAKEGRTADAAYATLEKNRYKDKHAHTQYTDDIPVIMRRPVRLYRSPEITTTTTTMTAVNAHAS